MIRVAQITSSSEYGGAEQVFCALARSLDPSRYEVFAICPPGARYLPELMAGPCRVLPVFQRFVPRGLVPLARTLRGLRIQVVHTHLMAAEGVGIPAAVLARVPVIVSTVHGYNYWSPHHRGLRRLRYRVAASLYRLRYAACAAVIAVSAGVADDLQTRPGVGVSARKIHVVPNAIDVDRFALAADGGRDPGKPVVLTVANFQPGKGHEVLVQAATRVLRAFPLAEFWLVGDGPERARIESQVRAAGIQSSVRFLGTRRDVPELMAAASVVAVPSHLEGFGIVAVEALAAGRPVVSTAAGGLAEFLEDGQTALLVTPGDAAGFAEAIAALLGDEPRRRAMAARGQAAARARFSLGPWIRRIEDLYQELVGGGRRA